MAPETFIIRSIFAQNTIMLLFLGIVASLLVYSLLKKRPKHIVAFSVWLVLVVWFFNSPFFGFSAVTVSPEGIKLNYGILSFRNDVLHLNTEWKVETYMSGIRRAKRLYFISIGDRHSMKVKGQNKLRLLQSVGKSIDLMKSGSSTGR
jgi:hypothetical protein